MIDLKVDPTTGEFVIEGGDLVLVDGAEAARQDLDARLRLVRGEWFLAPSLGIQLFDDVLVKSPNTSAIASIYRTAILASPYVGSITSFEFSLNRAARTLSISFSVLLATSAIVGAAAETPIDVVLDDVSFGIPIFG